MSAIRLFVLVKERGEGLAEECPGAMPERQKWVEDRSLTGFDERCWKEAGRGAGMEVEEVSADGDAEMMLAFVIEGSVGEMCEGEVCCGFVGVG